MRRMKPPKVLSKVLYCRVDATPQIIQKSWKLRDWLLPLNNVILNVMSPKTVDWPNNYLCVGLDKYVIVLQYDPESEYEKYLQLPINTCITKMIWELTLKQIADPMGMTDLPLDAKWRGDCYIIRILPGDDADEILTDYNHDEFLDIVKKYKHTHNF